MATPEHEDNLAMSVYVVDYHYDSEKLSLKCQTRPQHRAFMRHLNALGTVLSAGRTADLPDKGSMTIMLARTPEEAKEVLHDDPYIQAGIVNSITVREWQPVIGTFADE